MAERGFFALAGGGESDDSEDSWDIGFRREEPSKLKNSLQTEDKEESLKKALTVGNVTLVEQLLDAGVNVESRFQFGWTPLMYAASVANLELVRILLGRGANASFDKDKYTVLMAACSAHSSEEKIVKCVELLLSRNANPNVACRKRMTPVMMAAREGYAQVVALLVAHAAEINVQDENGYTALTWAASQGHKNTVLRLLELGADKSLQTKDGETPGEIAYKYNHSELFSMLSLSSNNLWGKFQSVTKEEAIYKCLKSGPDTVKDYSNSYCINFGGLEVFLHGLDLKHLTDVLKANKITLPHLLTMGPDDLQKIGIKCKDQKKILDAAKEMQVEKGTFEELSELINSEASCDELLTLLLKLNWQCSYLTTIVENINSQLPVNPHKIVLEMDSPQKLTLVCEDIKCSIEDLKKEICKLQGCLNTLQIGQKNVSTRVSSVENQKWHNGLMKKTAVTLFGIGFIFIVTKLSGSKNRFF
ncbi:ankyrin repeat, SAM and basic leucine zipper domain-containing protein 1 isoform X2 [Rhinatrema bivittatum]|uniref:ankyrin repeat, SAM and basic leucine zipper domain-containing protein 1 isoform X2 n=1 Tax=Rhinatrema bivittatum TaxID=194408 RepID=UPI00112E8AF2|nr:ankyrin repeat, SAM and basic leucine zipper domain-containing protein 1 isoform X2 [Rhinatrema bivittatum]